MSPFTAPQNIVFKTCCLALLLLLTFSGHSQKINYTTYTDKDGLPSNHIYRCVEDDHGFLWVATDGGIARFDGKYFQVFTTKEGLPDNEVLSVVKEKNGTIWVNCFKQSPAYFDEKQNRFINSTVDSNLARVRGTTRMILYALPGGGVAYSNETGTFIFGDAQEKEVKFAEIRKGFPITYFPDGSRVVWRSYPSDTATESSKRVIYHLQAGKVLDSVVSPSNNKDYPLAYRNENCFYVFSGSTRKVYVYSNFQTSPFRFQTDSLTINEPFTHFEFTPTCFYILGVSGKMYIYNKTSLQLLKQISGDFLPNSYYNDTHGNEWISTIDKGLIVYRNNSLTEVGIPATYTRRNFLSIARKKNGALLAGNFYGEVIEANRGEFTVHKVLKITPTRQRKIIVSGEDVYSFSEAGTFINFKTPLINHSTGLPHPGKTAILFNDSTIYIGYTTGILHLDTRTKKMRIIRTGGKRVTAMAKGKEGQLYFGSTDGLYRYNTFSDTTVLISLINGVPDYRITSLTVTPDGLIWAGTGGHGVYVLKNEILVVKITVEEGLIDNSIRSISPGRTGSVWIGTSHGISMINYLSKQGFTTRSIQNSTVNDGLTSNEINDMLFENDTMFLATADGITVLPGDHSMAPLHIPLRLISLIVNDKQMPLSTRFNLDHRERNINIRLAGIDLGGHFKHFQYLIDDNSVWITSAENTINLQLGYGHHTLKARAIDVNGNASNSILTLEFNVDTPFWNTFWFLVTVLAILQILFLLLAIRIIRTRKRTRLAKDIAGVQTASLKQQAFTSLMNPHFIFNALNSIQHYINLQDRQNANRYLSDFASLIRKNFDAAQRSFITLDEELESIRIYLRLEQMRFRDRFTYKLEISEDVNVEDWMVPTMMIQPLVENAILHGLMPSGEPGTLMLSFKVVGNYLEINITDDGIGVQNSSARKNNNNHHNSSSVDLIKKRLAALGHFVKEPVSLFERPTFASREYPGHTITIRLPLHLYNSWLHAQGHSLGGEPFSRS